MSSQLKPLGGVLDNVINRLAAIEAQLGITPPSDTAPSNFTEAAAAVIEEELHPRLVAYDEHITRALNPFTESCKALGAEMDAIGAHTFSRSGVECAVSSNSERCTNDPLVMSPPPFNPI